MCGRYAFAPSKKQQQTQLADVDIPTDLHLSYNIAPTHTAYVLANDQPRRLQLMTWGLVPYWSKDGLNTGRLINARAEGIAEKPSFREPILHRRCLVPADSFYEWRTGPGRRKIPYRILLQNGELLMMAGIWDEWGPRRHRTFSVITTTPNKEVADLHDRMPVLLLTPAEQQAWVSDQPLDKVLAMLHPPADGVLQLYRVGEQLNSPGADGPSLQEAIPEDLLLF